jgi:Domain of unknown function (DUF4386)
MSLSRKPGRVAGLWYLALTLLGPIRLIYIPGRLFTTDNASTIVQNIAAHTRLFGVGIAAELAGGVVLIFLTLAFYQLFKDVNWNAAALVLIFGGVMPAVIDFFNAALDLQALEIARGAEFLSAVDKTHQDVIASLMISLGNHSNTAAELLWGLWLFPLGFLVYKSRFLPRFLGVWLYANGFAYVAVWFAGIFAPQFQAKVFNWSFPILLGEVALMLWLVIRGARPPAPATAL